jgi:hypothetical protein
VIDDIVFKHLVHKGLPTEEKVLEVGRDEKETVLALELKLIDEEYLSAS